jgi:preprotein translocase subunit YajC
MFLLAWQFFLAQTSSEGGTGTAAGGNPLLTFAPLVVISILFYFFLIRSPMKKQEAERQALLSAMKKNDKVVTSGGIIGIVASIKEKEDEVTLKVDESSNVRLRVLKSSIVKIVSPDEPAKDSKESPDTRIKASN